MLLVHISELGLVLPIKNPEKFSEFWQNYPTSENSRYFSNCVLSKILKKILQKFCQLAAQKNLSEKFPDFQEKIGGF
jgi:hypothetical protein